MYSRLISWRLEGGVGGGDGHANLMFQLVIGLKYEVGGFSILGLVHSWFISVCI
jgi:hypothetical protein